MTNAYVGPYVRCLAPAEGVSPTDLEKQLDGRLKCALWEWDDAGCDAAYFIPLVDYGGGLQNIGQVLERGGVARIQFETLESMRYFRGFFKVDLELLQKKYQVAILQFGVIVPKPRADEKP